MVCKYTSRMTMRAFTFMRKHVTDLLRTLDIVDAGLLYASPSVAYPARWEWSVICLVPTILLMTDHIIECCIPAVAL